MNNPFDFFDKIFCINLKERTDRWENCLKNFDKYDIKNHERVEAIKINGDLHPKRKGQIGCALSFAKCFNKIKEEQLEKVLILEDDFEFKYDKEILFDKINNSLKDLPQNWDSLYFGGTLINDYGINPIQKFSHHLFKLNSAHCLHCTAFSKAGTNKIFEYFKNEKNWHLNLINNFENMDVFMAQVFQKSTNSYITNEILCYQKVSLSNIENCIFDYKDWMDNNFKTFASIINNER